jgi:hypothetical protein
MQKKKIKLTLRTEYKMQRHTGNTTDISALTRNSATADSDHCDAFYNLYNKATALLSVAYLGGGGHCAMAPPLA